MALPTDRESFKRYCLRKLGEPVIEVNVDPDQVDDRVDEALQLYYDFHFDGTEKIYIAHQVTPTDRTNKYISIPDDVIGVINIFDIGYQTSAQNMFNLRYQIMLNDLYDLSSTNMTSFYIGMQYLALIEEILVGKQPIRFNRHTNKLYIDMDWGRVVDGYFIIIEGYKKLDPVDNPDVWKDRWLIDYATALIRLQWGENLSKFVGMTLPGGIQFNGEGIKAQAQEDLMTLRDELINSYSLPSVDMIG